MPAIISPSATPQHPHSPTQSDGINHYHIDSFNEADSSDEDSFWVYSESTDGTTSYDWRDPSDSTLSSRTTSVGKDALSSVARFFGFTPTVAWMIGGITFLTLCSAGIVCPPLGIGLLTTLFALSSVGVIGANWKAVT